jgi:hypothetical protein
MYEAPPPPPASPPRQTSPKSKRHSKKGTETSSSVSRVKSHLPSPALVGSTFATNLKGGSFDRPVTPTSRRVSTGSPGSPETPSSQRIRNQRGSVSTSARAANIKYPIFQPDFSPPEPPPPPPPPKHRFKITLGMKHGPSRTPGAATATPLSRQDSHRLKNDILIVQQVNGDRENGRGLSYKVAPSSPRDKRNVIQNTTKNRPLIVRSNSGGLTVSASLPPILLSCR